MFHIIFIDFQYNGRRPSWILREILHLPFDHFYQFYDVAFTVLASLVRIFYPQPKIRHRISNMAAVVWIYFWHWS